MALYLDVSVGEVLVFEKGRIKIMLESKTGPKARVCIEADRSIHIEKVQQISNDAPAMGLKKRS